MVERFKTHSRNKSRLYQKQNENDFDLLRDQLRERKKQSLNLQKANPIHLIKSALVPLLVSIILFVVVGAPVRHPDVSVYAGKLIPSSIIETGAVIAKTDNSFISEDFELDFPSVGEKTLMIVWDYAREDGDMVSVLFDGKPIGESFTIYHAPKTIKVPKGARVEVIGTFDGGGGITYAVNFPEIDTTILNGLDAGEQNNYFLKK